MDSDPPPPNSALLICATALALMAPMGSHAQTVTPAATNAFNDPFLRLTSGIANCPTPVGPHYTADEARREAHWRAERGTSCFLDGRCRLPNAYAYDSEVIPRVQKAVLADGRFGDTSVWAWGQRRWVMLAGCVRTAEQAQALEALVRRIDDVEAVIPDLSVRP